MIGSAEMVAYGADYGSYCAAWEDGACKPDSDPDCQAGPGHKCGTKKDCKALWETYTDGVDTYHYDFNQDQTWCCDAWCYVNSTTCDAAKYGIEVKESWLKIPGLNYSYSACGYDQFNAEKDPKYLDQAASDATMDGSFPKSFPDEMTASNFCRHAGASACTGENADTTGITSQCWSHMKSYCAAVGANDRACTHDCDNVNFTAANPETMVDPKCKLALGMPCAKSYATYTSSTCPYKVQPTGCECIGENAGLGTANLQKFGQDYGKWCAAWEDGKITPGATKTSGMGKHTGGTATNCSAMWGGDSTSPTYDFSVAQPWCCAAWCYVNASTCNASKWGIDIASSWTGSDLVFSYGACADWKDRPTMPSNEPQGLAANFAQYNCSTCPFAQPDMTNFTNCSGETLFNRSLGSLASSAACVKNRKHKLELGWQDKKSNGVCAIGSGKTNSKMCSTCKASNGMRVTSQRGCAQACLDEPSGTCIGYAFNSEIEDSTQTSWCILYGPEVHKDLDTDVPSDLKITKSFGDLSEGVWISGEAAAKPCVTKEDTSFTPDLLANPEGCTGIDSAGDDSGVIDTVNASKYSYYCVLLKEDHDRWKAHGDYIVTMSVKLPIKKGDFCEDFDEDYRDWETFESCDSNMAKAFRRAIAKAAGIEVVLGDVVIEKIAGATANISHLTGVQEYTDENPESVTINLKLTPIVSQTEADNIVALLNETTINKELMVYGIPKTGNATIVTAATSQKLGANRKFKIDVHTNANAKNFPSSYTNVTKLRLKQKMAKLALVQDSDVSLTVTTVDEVTKNDMCKICPSDPNTTIDTQLRQDWQANTLKYKNIINCAASTNTNCSVTGLPTRAKGYPPSKCKDLSGTCTVQTATGMFADQGFAGQGFSLKQKGCRVTATADSTATGLNMRWTVLDSSQSKYAIYAFGTDTTTLGATVECYQSKGQNLCKIEKVDDWSTDDKLEMQCTYTDSERFLSPEVDLSFEISTSSKAELTMRALLDAQACLSCKPVDVC